MEILPERLGDWLSACLRRQPPRARLVAAGGALSVRGRGVRQVFPEAKLVFLIVGNWELAWGGRREQLTAGDLWLVAAGTHHAERCLPPGPIRVLALFCAGDDLRIHLAEVVPPLTAQPLVQAVWPAARGRLISQLIALLATDDLPAASAQRTRDLLFDRLRAVARLPCQPIARAGGTLVLTAGRRLIEERHADPGFTIARLARDLHLHPASLARAWRRLAGTGPAVELAHRRLHTAQELLRTTALPIAEIARRSGYARHDSFTRHFRARTGQSPESWRVLGVLREEVGAPPP